MNFFQRRRILKRLNVLEATPVRVCAHEPGEADLISVVVPKFRNILINQIFLQRRSKNFFIRLDRFGSATWLAIDGNKNVEAICRELEEKFGDEVRPVDERVSKFLSLLYEQRYITFKELQHAE